MISLEQLQAGIVIPIDKPRQWTSFQTVNKIKATIRNLYGINRFKIGHAGTLDPLATGLLLVCVGRATKLIPQLQDGPKTYTGTLVLGATTPCYDLEQAIDQYYDYTHITPPLLQQTAQQFTGHIQQVPPIFSAIKIGGQRAYEYARRDDPTAIPQPKPVTVYQFEITNFRPANPQAPIPTDAPLPTIGHTRAPHLYDHPQGTVPPHLPQADFAIHCSKGTYIRSLARDLGLALGSGAFLAALRRTQIGHYHIDNSLTLSEVDTFLQAPENYPDITT